MYTYQIVHWEEFLSKNTFEFLYFLVFNVELIPFCKTRVLWMPRPVE